MLWLVEALRQQWELRPGMRVLDTGWRKARQTMYQASYNRNDNGTGARTILNMIHITS